MRGDASYPLGSTQTGGCGAMLRTGASRTIWALMRVVAVAALACSCSIELPAPGQGAYLGQTSAGGDRSGSCPDGTADPDCFASSDPASCVGKANGTACTDNDPTTTNDACAETVCVGARFADFFVNSLEDTESGGCTAAKCALRDAMLAAMATSQTGCRIPATFWPRRLTWRRERPRPRPGRESCRGRRATALC